MPLTVDTDTLEDRARLPAHEKAALEWYALALLVKRRRRGRNDSRESRAAMRSVRGILYALLLHGVSYDKIYRAPVSGMAPPVMLPWAVFSPQRCRDDTGFDPDKFLYVCSLLVLLPAFIPQTNRRRVSREFAIYVLLRRWRSAGTWNLVVNELRLQRQTLVGIYTSTLSLVAQHYRGSVTIPDVVRIRPQLAAWAANVAAKTLSATDRIVVRACVRACASQVPAPRVFRAPRALCCVWCTHRLLRLCSSSRGGVLKAWVDGKAVQTCRPRSPEYHKRHAAEMARLGATLNEMQRAHHNGFYGFHGIKVQVRA